MNTMINSNDGIFQFDGTRIPFSLLH